MRALHKVVLSALLLLIPGCNRVFIWEVDTIEVGCPGFDSDPDASSNVRLDIVANLYTQFDDKLEHTRYMRFVTPSYPEVASTLRLEDSFVAHPDFPLPALPLTTEPTGGGEIGRVEFLVDAWTVVDGPDGQPVEVPVKVVSVNDKGFASHYGAGPQAPIEIVCTHGDPATTTVSGVLEIELELPGCAGVAPVCIEDLSIADSAQTIPLSANPYWATNYGAPHTIALIEDALYWGPDTGEQGEGFFRFDMTTNTVQELSGPGEGNGSQNELCACGYTQASAAVGNSIYVFGNWGESYNVVTDTWTKANYPEEFQSGERVAAVFDSEIYLLAGRVDADRVDIFNTVTQTWRQGPSLPVEVDWDFTAVAHQDLLYFIATDPIDYRTRIFHSGPEAGQWIEGPSFNGSDEFHDPRPMGAAAYGDKIYVLSARGILVYNTLTQSWCEGVVFDTDLQDPRILQNENGMFVIGSENDDLVIRELFVNGQAAPIP